MRIAVLGACALFVASTAAQAAGPTAETVSSWNRYVASSVPRLHACRQRCGVGEPQGRTIEVAGGTIHHWRGSVLVRGANVERVLSRLEWPGTPPPQEDVLESRVLSRSGSSLRVYLKLARSAVITVVYDTEHDVTFERRSPGLATSRSVSARIAETGGGDRGFLWRLNSYWRYVQQGNDVRIDLESMSLSRDIPAVAQLLVSPIVQRVARESMERTLASVKRFLES